MTAMQSMPQVQECSVSSCSYNAESSCHAGAITIAGDHAHCGTFVEISFRGGLDRAGLVGACHRSRRTVNRGASPTLATAPPQWQQPTRSAHAGERAPLP